MIHYFHFFLVASLFITVLAFLPASLPFLIFYSPFSFPPFLFSHTHIFLVSHIPHFIQPSFDFQIASLRFLWIWLSLFLKFIQFYFSSSFLHSFIRVEIFLFPCSLFTTFSLFLFSLTFNFTFHFILLFSIPTSFSSHNFTSFLQFSFSSFLPLSLIFPHSSSHCRPHTHAINIQVQDDDAIKTRDWLVEV